MSDVPSFAERVAIHMAPRWYVDAHPAPGSGAAALSDVARWVDHVTEVRATLRSAAVVGAGLLTQPMLAAVTGMGEGDSLIALATHHDRPDVVELLEEWLTALRARGPDGKPLHEDPTGAHAAVVHLTDRAPRTRRTS